MNTVRPELQGSGDCAVMIFDLSRGPLTAWRGGIRRGYDYLSLLYLRQFPNIHRLPRSREYLSIGDGAPCPVVVMFGGQVAHDCGIVDGSSNLLRVLHFGVAEYVDGSRCCGGDETGLGCYGMMLGGRVSLTWVNREELSGKKLLAVPGGQISSEAEVILICPSAATNKQALQTPENLLLPVLKSFGASRQVEPSPVE